MKQVEKAPPTTTDHSQVLSEWAVLGAELVSCRRGPVPTWDPASQLIEVVREKLKGEAVRLRDVLEQSRRRLAPLEDPFDLDLGLHRWLAGEREEAYSDWLHWVLEQTGNPLTVMRLLNIEPPHDLADWKDENPSIEREFPIPYGHKGQTGRLDILIRYADQMLIAVEIKKVSAKEADTAKNEGYAQWLREQRKQYKHEPQGVLLATAPETKGDKEFPFVSWAHVCTELRKVAPTLSQQNRRLTAAMVLAFVAAVEQNLLGFSPSLVRNICDGNSSLFTTTVIEHLENSLK